MESLYQFAVAHKAAAIVAAGWIARETPVVWRALCRAATYVMSNNGLLGVTNSILRGKPAQEKEQPKP